MIRSLSLHLDRYQNNVNHLKDKLQALDYHSVLKRGFSIAKNKSNQIIKSINQVKLEDQLELLMIDGNLKTKVTSKQKG